MARKTTTTKVAPKPEAVKAEPEVETPQAPAPDATPDDGEAIAQETTRSSSERQHRDSANKKLEITAARDPYRRAGLALGKNPLIIAIDDLDDDQREALDADPNVFIRQHIPEAALKQLSGSATKGQE